ncbi:triose-phosphate isomerase [Chitinasiproducens palmae]|uniref:Triosephosphate isomerase n=1 Tax=Chitinasiproducens palmae TaxID=1770053 RepID=A0A1H2PSP5_9BURK|nr:triose-phosphate isomerase [Chitinasiproducens palmae]SDV50013.1 triosephosphate isomerase [Chitinasiproducens palmae]
MASRAKWVVGNWKMHGSLADNAGLLESIAAAPASGARIGVCVPFPYLVQARDVLLSSSVAWGVQDLSMYPKGAYTGEVSAQMAVEFGATLAIVGHSERRTYHREADDVVAQKTLRALEAAITPIVCVGETLEEREAGSTEQVVGRQLDAVLAVLDAQQAERILVAYEPVWAIGTGKSASAAEAQAVHAFLRERLRAKSAALDAVTILYGGSVKPGNATELFGMPDIDGGLIGGASLVADDFLAICRAAA